MAGMVEGKVAIVTGGSRGIGKATALLFAAEGADVVIADILDTAGEETAEQVQTLGRKAIYLHCDVSKPGDVRNMIETTANTFGRLDCLVNNAGVEGAAKPLTEIDPEEFDFLTGINLRGVWLGMKYGIEKMLAFGNGGAIVNLSSLAGHVAYPGIAPYVMSKHGVNGLTKTAALEFSEQGIRTNSVCPGAILTDMIEEIARSTGASSANEAFAHLYPIRRLGTPEEVAEAIVWLCSDRASNITGALLNVDGGYVAQ